MTKALPSFDPMSGVDILWAYAKGLLSAGQAVDLLALDSMAELVEVMEARNIPLPSRAIPTPRGLRVGSPPGTPSPGSRPKGR